MTLDTGSPELLPALLVGGIGGLIAVAHRGYLSEQVWGLILVAGLPSLLVGGLIAALESRACVTDPRVGQRRRAPGCGTRPSRQYFLSRFGGT